MSYEALFRERNFLTGRDFPIPKLPSQPILKNEMVSLSLKSDKLCEVGALQSMTADFFELTALIIASTIIG